MSKAITPGKMYVSPSKSVVFLCSQRPDFTQKFGPEQRLEPEQGPFLVVVNEQRVVPGRYPDEPARERTFWWLEVVDNTGKHRKGWAASAEELKPL